jgi:hypothetical protein
MNGWQAVEFQHCIRRGGSLQLLDKPLRFGRVPPHASAALTSHACAEAAVPYELGGTLAFPYLYPVWVRGQAYLAAHNGVAAAAEFHKVIDHPGIVINQPIGSPAHLELGRAYALSGDNVKARAAYQNFLTLWKDADPRHPHPHCC